MRRLLPLLLVLLPIAAGAQAPATGAAQPPVLRIPGLSPAGVAALEKLKNRQDPAVASQVKAETAIRQQMGATLSAPTIDLDRLTALMAQARTVQTNGRKIMDDHLLVMLRALPPVDRPVFLRAVANPRGVAPAR